MNVTEANSTEEDPSEMFHPVVYTHAYLMVVSLLGIIPNVLLIIILSKFNVLRNTRNMLIMNWAITDILTLLGEPSKPVVISYLIGKFNDKTADRIYYAFMSFMCVSHSYEIIIVFLLFVDCYYKKLTVPKLVRTIPFLWITYVCILIPSVILTFLYSNVHLDLLTYGFLYMSLVITFLVKTVLYIARRARSKPLKQKIRFILTGGYLFILLCSFIAQLLDSLYVLSLPFQLRQALIMIFEGCSFIYAYVILALLYCLDNDFKQCFKKLFSRNNNVDSVTFNPKDDNLQIM